MSGCRPHELLGAAWAVEPIRFSALVEVARGVDLIQLRAQREQIAPAPRVPYIVGDDGVALMNFRGLFVKHPTSFSALFDEVSTVQARADLRAAVRDPKVAAVLVRVDSPGGVADGSADLAVALREAAAQKPLIAFVDGLAASAALWAISGASSIIAARGSFVGSVGVYGTVLDSEKAESLRGLSVHVISSAPPLKGAAVPGTALTPEQLEEFRRNVDAIARLFVDDLAAGRKVSRAKAESWHTGQLHVAAEALALGLVDAVGTFEDARALAAGMAKAKATVQTAPVRAAIAPAPIAPLRLVPPVAPKVREFSEVRAYQSAIDAAMARGLSRGYARALVHQRQPELRSRIVDRLRSEIASERAAELAEALRPDGGEAA